MDYIIGQMARMQQCIFTSARDFINLEFPAEKSFMADGKGKVTRLFKKGEQRGPSASQRK